METVSWDDCQAFIAKLNGLVPGLQAHLPTEAQWEYACCAGTSTAFSFGNNISTEQVNYHGYNPYPNGQEGLYRRKSVPVKSLAANAWGLYEMHGNVWEWCQDWYGEYPDASVVDPTGADSGVNRVLRGGSWFNNGGRTRSANRINVERDHRNYDLGFRLALGQPASPCK